jgi:hypothetical protein
MDNLDYIPTGYWKCGTCNVLVKEGETHYCYQGYDYQYFYLSDRGILLQIVGLLQDIKEMVGKL